MFVQQCCKHGCLCACRGASLVTWSHAASLEKDVVKVFLLCVCVCSVEFCS